MLKCRRKASTPARFIGDSGSLGYMPLSYNSQSATDQHEPFGNKWQFNYGSFLTVDSSHSVLIFMPDGRRDLYVPDGAGGYTRPYKGYNTLTKIAENHFELRFPDDTVYVYNIPSGTSSLQPYLVEIRDVYGQSLRFQYNSDVQLLEKADPAKAFRAIRRTATA